MSKESKKSEKVETVSAEEEEKEQKLEEKVKKIRKKKVRDALPVDNLVVIDATNLILGRLASVVASRLIQGERVAVINAEKSVITGNKGEIVSRYKLKLQIRTHTNPSKGPFHYKRPDRIVKRTIRGMLPWKKPKGKAAYKRLRVYIGVPEYLKQVPVQTIPHADIKKSNSSYITVETLSNEIGWVSPVG
ncbi:MAG: 50S ribosomal protein L13 [Candidatus Jordarchaeaceae archaeon]